MTEAPPAAPPALEQVTDYKTREAWLAARRRGIGASESPALFGLSPWTSPLAVWVEKKGGPPKQLDREWVEWGQLLEPVIAERYQQITGRKLWSFSPYCIAAHPQLPFMLSTPDRWIIEAHDREGQGLLEVKNSQDEDAWQNGPPLYYQCQVQHQLAVTGRDWGALVVLLSGNRIRHWDIDRNETFIAQLQDMCAWFWDLVQSDEPPPLDAHPATLNVLKRLHPLDNGQLITLPPQAVEFWEALQKAKVDEKEALARQQAAEIQLRALMGPNTWGELPDGRLLSLKHTTVKAHDVHYPINTYRSLKEVGTGTAKKIRRDTAAAKKGTTNK